MKMLTACLIALVGTLAVNGENVLDDDAFWNMDTAYAEPAVETATRILDSAEFEFADAWDLVLVFATDFSGGYPRGSILIMR